MGKLVMGYWDCPVCGTKGIQGDVMNCPSCGRARGDVQFYMKSGAENAPREANDRKDIEYLSEEKAAEIGKNPDWYCSFCNSLNHDNAAFCSNCGASRESSDSNYFDQLKKRQQAQQAEAAAQASISPAVTKSKRPLYILLAVIIAVAGLIFYFNSNKTRGDLQVTGLAWSRSIPVEQNIEYTEEGWNLPEGANVISQRNEIHHYDQVLDHHEKVEVQKSRRVLDHYETYYTYSDNGNGTFEEVEHQRPVYSTEYYTETESRPVYRSVPRYATKYTYTIWRWTPSRTAAASGTDHNTYWPDLNLKEDEREGSPRSESYSFTVVDRKGNSTSWELAESDWMNIEVESNLNITSKRTGSNAWITDDDGKQIAQVTQKK